MRRRHELTDAQWARLAPLLPPRKAGKPRKDDRLVINGILWKLATGAPWRDLPERYGPWQRVYTRFRRWTRAGVWDRIFAAVQQQADAAGQLDWAVHYTIPRLRTERRSGRFDRTVYRLRHRVEQLIARCKQLRSLATRYDKRATSYRALWLIAMIMLWITHAHRRHALVTCLPWEHGLKPAPTRAYALRERRMACWTNTERARTTSWMSAGRAGSSANRGRS